MNTERKQQKLIEQQYSDQIQNHILIFGEPKIHQKKKRNYKQAATPYLNSHSNPERQKNIINVKVQQRIKQNPQIKIQANLFGLNLRGSTDNRFDAVVNQQTAHQIILKKQKQLPPLKDQQSKKNKLINIRNNIIGIAQQTQQQKETNQLKLISEKLKGKVFIIWIFISKQKLPQQIQNRIRKMYKGIQPGDNYKKHVVPICNFGWQFRPFLQITNCTFKIVTDLENAQQALRFKINNRVVEYYIYNNNGQQGFNKALEFKSQSKKVKEIFSDFTSVIERAQQEIQNQVELFLLKNSNKMTMKLKQNRKFPSFLRLIGQQKTKGVLYRSNLYGALKISVQQKKQYYRNFVDLVKQQYKTKEDDINLEQYSKMQHFTNVHKLDIAKPVLKFYSRQTFYYKILNSMLRTLKTTSQFKSCVLPFNQTYHSIKMLYKQSIKCQQDGSRRLQQKTYYRGAKLRRRDFQYLKPGVFIEMFGFVSTSKNREKAMQFADEDCYIFQIKVPSITIPKKFDKYDHGFVDLNQFSLSTFFASEQQILFNALNVYRVKSLRTDLNANGVEYCIIQLQYGVIFNLASTAQQQLSTSQKDVLINYQYCTKMQDEIDDQGDVYLIANQHQQCIKYYQNKIKDNDNDYNAHYKMANVLQTVGKLDNAEVHANRTIQILQQVFRNQTELREDENERALKVFSVHVKNARLKLDQENYIVAETQLDRCLEQQPQDLDKAKILRQYGQVKFKAGDIRQAFNKLHQAERIYQQQIKQYTKLKKQAQQQFQITFFQRIGALCSGSQLFRQRQINKNRRINQIEKQQMKHISMKKQIIEEKLKLNKSLRQVAKYAEDQEQYQRCVLKGRLELHRYNYYHSDDSLEKAKYRYLQATVKVYQNLVDVQRLLEQAIELVQRTDKNNILIAEYSQKLASLQKLQLQKNINLNNYMEQKQNSLQEKINYDQQRHRQTYQKCKKNYQRAINVLLYNNKTKQSRQIAALRNKLGELEFNERKFKQSQIILLAYTKPQSELNIEKSKSHYLLAKISISRGQLKSAFQYIFDAQYILRRVLVKQETPSYIRNFQRNNQHINNLFLRSKIYHKQLKIDQSLRDLNSIQNQLAQIYDKNAHSLFSKVYEEKAQISLQLKDFQKMSDYFTMAIQITTKQAGQYAIQNGIYYCNFAKHLVIFGENQQAQENQQKARIIFSRLSQNHPIFWLVIFTQAFILDYKKQFQKSLPLYKKSQSFAERRYDKQHISISQIKLKYIKNLINCSLVEESLKQLEKFEDQLQSSIRQSNERVKLDKQEDDQKVYLSKLVLTTMKKAYQQLRKKQQAQICNFKIQNLQKTYLFSQQFLI